MLNEGFSQAGHSVALIHGRLNPVEKENQRLRWSAIQMKQIEGRTHRDGKFSQVYWMLGVDTIEEQIAEIVACRLRAMSALHGDGATIADVEKMLSAPARLPT